MPFTSLAVAPGPLRWCDIALSDVLIRALFQLRYFENFFMNYDLINDKKSTVIQFGTCNVDVFCQL